MTPGDNNAPTRGTEVLATSDERLDTNYFEQLNDAFEREVISGNYNQGETVREVVRNHRSERSFLELAGDFISNMGEGLRWVATIAIDRFAGTAIGQRLFGDWIERYHQITRPVQAARDTVTGMMTNGREALSEVREDALEAISDHPALAALGGGFMALSGTLFASDRLRSYLGVSRLASVPGAIAALGRIPAVLGLLLRGGLAGGAVYGVYRGYQYLAENPEFLEQIPGNPLQAKEWFIDLLTNLDLGEDFTAEMAATAAGLFTGTVDNIEELVEQIRNIDPEAIAERVRNFDPEEAMAEGRERLANREEAPDGFIYLDDYIEEKQNQFNELFSEVQGFIERNAGFLLFSGIAATSFSPTRFLLTRSARGSINTGINTLEMLAKLPIEMGGTNLAQLAAGLGIAYMLRDELSYMVDISSGRMLIPDTAELRRELLDRAVEAIQSNTPEDAEWITENVDFESEEFQTALDYISGIKAIDFNIDINAQELGLALANFAAEEFSPENVLAYSNSVGISNFTNTIENLNTEDQYSELIEFLNTLDTEIGNGSRTLSPEDLETIIQLTQNTPFNIEETNEDTYVWLYTDEDGLSSEPQTLCVNPSLSTRRQHRAASRFRTHLSGFEAYTNSFDSIIAGGALEIQEIAERIQNGQHWLRVIGGEVILEGTLERYVLGPIDVAGPLFEELSNIIPGGEPVEAHEVLVEYGPYIVPLMIVGTVHGAARGIATAITNPGNRIRRGMAAGMGAWGRTVTSPITIPLNVAWKSIKLSMNLPFRRGRGLIANSARTIIPRISSPSVSLVRAVLEPIRNDAINERFGLSNLDPQLRNTLNVHLLERQFLLRSGRATGWFHRNSFTRNIPDLLRSSGFVNDVNTKGENWLLINGDEKIEFDPTKDANVTKPNGDIVLGRNELYNRIVAYRNTLGGENARIERFNTMLNRARVDLELNRNRTLVRNELRRIRRNGGTNADLERINNLLSDDMLDITRSNISSIDELDSVIEEIEQRITESHEQRRQWNQSTSRTRRWLGIEIPGLNQLITDEARANILASNATTSIPEEAEDTSTRQAPQASRPRLSPEDIEMREIVRGYLDAVKNGETEFSQSEVNRRLEALGLDTVESANQLNTRIQQIDDTLEEARTNIDTSSAQSNSRPVSIDLSDAPETSSQRVARIHANAPEVSNPSSTQLARGGGAGVSRGIDTVDAPRHSINRRTALIATVAAITQLSFTANSFRNNNLPDIGNYAPTPNPSPDPQRSQDIPEQSLEILNGSNVEHLAEMDPQDIFNSASENLREENYQQAIQEYTYLLENHTLEEDDEAVTRSFLGEAEHQLAREIYQQAQAIMLEDQDRATALLEIASELQVLAAQDHPNNNFLPLWLTEEELSEQIDTRTRIFEIQRDLGQPYNEIDEYLTPQNLREVSRFSFATMNEIFTDIHETQVQTAQDTIRENYDLFLEHLRNEHLTGGETEIPISNWSKIVYNSEDDTVELDYAGPIKFANNLYSTFDMMSVFFAVEEAAGLDRSALDEMYELREQYNTERFEILNDPDLTDEEKERRINELADLTISRADVIQNNINTAYASGLTASALPGVGSGFDLMRVRNAIERGQGGKAVLESGFYLGSTLADFYSFGQAGSAARLARATERIHSIVRNLDRFKDYVNTTRVSNGLIHMARFEWRANELIFGNRFSRIIANARDSANGAASSSFLARYIERSGRVIEPTVDRFSNAYAQFALADMGYHIGYQMVAPELNRTFTLHSTDEISETNYESRASLATEASLTYEELNDLMDVERETGSNSITVLYNLAANPLIHMPEGSFESIDFSNQEADTFLRFLLTVKESDSSAFQVLERYLNNPSINANSIRFIVRQLHEFNDVGGGAKATFLENVVRHPETDLETLQLIVNNYQDQRLLALQAVVALAQEKIEELNQ